MNIQELITMFGIVNTLYGNRRWIDILLRKTKTGRIIAGIIILPYFIYIILRLCKLYNMKPELFTRVQKKITDFY